MVKQNHIWSPYQKAIFKDFNNGQGHTIIEARAGAAKTSSIVEGIKYIPKNKKVLVLAFNKIIQEEIKKKIIQNNVTCLTFHSIAFRAIKQRFGSNVELDNNKVFNILCSVFNKYEDRDLISNICDTVSYCKNSLSDSPRQIEDIIYNCDIDLCDVKLDQFISTVIKVLAIDKADTNKVDFDDMCWFAFVYNLYMGIYDIVCVDEYQDVNKSNLFIAKSTCGTSGRIIAAGDPLQDIYKFRLSDSEFIESLKEQPQSKVLSLPISYRCPKKVIELAKNWAENIECPETAIDGNVEEITQNKLLTTAKPGCFILSRTNAPLIGLCLKFLNLNIPANIAGRDIGKQLSYLIKKSKKKQIPAFVKWLDDWKEKEIKKALDKNLKVDSIKDRYDCLINLSENSQSISDMLSKIDKLFNDINEKNIITLSTVHKAKGRETDDVFVLKKTFKIWIDNTAEFSKPNDECNVVYVAITRSKNNLFIVN